MAPMSLFFFLLFRIRVRFVHLHHKLETSFEKLTNKKITLMQKSNAIEVPNGKE